MCQESVVKKISNTKVNLKKYNWFGAPAVLSRANAPTVLGLRSPIDFQLKIHTNSGGGQLAQFAANGYG